MPLPAEAITVQGGCNCRAIRYRVEIPALKERPANPYLTISYSGKKPDDGGNAQQRNSSDPSADEAESTPRMPMLATDHCNDCRRATGSILPFWMATPIGMVSAAITASPGDEQDTRDWRPGNEVFHTNPLPSKSESDEGTGQSSSPLTFYDSSPGRRRSFCSRCGTMLSYIAYSHGVPEGWPLMLDIVLGTLDREFLEKDDWFVPERQLWWDKGIPWVQKVSVSGFGEGKETPRHPLADMNKVVESKL